MEDQIDQFLEGTTFLVGTAHITRPTDRQPVPLYAQVETGGRERGASH
jgi:hypothetical protein